MSCGGLTDGCVSRGVLGGISGREGLWGVREDAVGIRGHERCWEWKEVPEDVPGVLGF